MKRASAPLGVVLLATASLAGCAPATKYDWGSYPAALLDYYRANTDRAVYDAALTETLTRAEASHRVPPGLYAEAGYEALSRGETEKAVGYFTKEKTAWPESGVFMDKAIAGAARPPTAQASQAPAS